MIIELPFGIIASSSNLIPVWMQKNGIEIWYEIDQMGVRRRRPWRAKLDLGRARRRRPWKGGGSQQHPSTTARASGAQPRMGD